MDGEGGERGVLKDTLKPVTDIGSTGAHGGIQDLMTRSRAQNKRVKRCHESTSNGIMVAEGNALRRDVIVLVTSSLQELLLEIALCQKLCKYEKD